MADDGDVVALALCRPDGIESLVLQHGDGLRRMCWSYLRDRETVEDVLQDTFCRVMERNPQFPPHVDLGAWLYRVAANLCIDEMRRRSRRSRTLIEGDFAEHALLGVADDDHGSQPETALDLDVTRELVRSSILGLPARQRDVLVLRDVMGYSEAETAAILGTSPASVQGLLHRAREAFRDAYTSTASDQSLPAQCRETTFVFEHLALTSVRKDRVRAIERHLSACARCQQVFCVAKPAAPTRHTVCASA